MCVHFILNRTKTCRHNNLGIITSDQMKRQVENSSPNMDMKKVQVEDSSPNMDMKKVLKSHQALLFQNKEDPNLIERTDKIPFAHTVGT